MCNGLYDALTHAFHSVLCARSVPASLLSYRCPAELSRIGSRGRRVAPPRPLHSRRAGYDLRALPDRPGHAVGMPAEPLGRKLYGFLAGGAISAQAVWRPGIDLGVIRSNAVVPVQSAWAPAAAKIPAVIVEVEGTHGQAGRAEGTRDRHPRRAVGVLVVPVVEAGHALAQLTEEPDLHRGPLPVSSPGQAPPWLGHITYLRRPADKMQRGCVEHLPHRFRCSDAARPVLPGRIATGKHWSRSAPGICERIRAPDSARRLETRQTLGER